MEVYTFVLAKKFFLQYSDMSTDVMLKLEETRQYSFGLLWTKEETHYCA